jgi:RNA polymerase sigma-70 factor, ECF subfamily
MDEHELIQKSVTGDEKAFTHLVEHHRGMVFRHCLSMVHDQEIAEDLTQETFVHAYQHLAGFRMEARFSTWLWRISHNLSLNYLKKHVSEQEFREEILPAQLLEKKPVDDEKMLKIREAMKHLSPKHKLVFEMYILKRIPQKQIAAELGIAYGTVRSRIHYARKEIKKFLQEA